MAGKIKPIVKSLNYVGGISQSDIINLEQLQDITKYKFIVDFSNCSLHQKLKKIELFKNFGSLTSFWLQFLVTNAIKNAELNKKKQGIDILLYINNVLHKIEVKSFIKTCCDVAPSSMTGKGRTYNSDKHKLWLDTFDYMIIINKNTFINNLKLEFVIVPSDILKIDISKTVNKQWLKTAGLI